MRTPSVSYAGGELSPALHSRADLEKYKTGLAFAENFMVRSEGGVMKRPGLYLVGETKFDYTSPVELVEWQIASDDAYLLEVGHLYIRFIRFGAILTSGGVPVEVATEFTNAEVRDLKFAFANDVAYIFHPDHATQLLKRTGLTTFSITPMPLVNDKPRPQITSVQYTNNLTPDDNYRPNLTPTSYKVAAIFSDGTESLPSDISTHPLDLGHHALTFRLNFSEVTPPAGVTVERYIMYKEKGGLFGFVGYIEPGNPTWLDTNIAPSFDTVPQRPFKGFGGFPAVGEFYKQRLAAGNVRGNPQNLWFSRIGLFNDFSDSLPIQEDDGFNFSLDGGGQHTIHHLVPLTKLIVFTGTAEWVLEQEGDGFSFSTVNPVPQSYYGSAAQLRPLKINERILFVEALSSSVRDFGYDFQSNGFVADDLTRLSRHLFKDTAIKSWAHAPFPYDLVFTVTSNGGLQHMTYLREDQIWGWTHSRTQGSFYAAGSLAEVSENAAYFIVDRIINGQKKRFIERMKFTAGKDVRDAFYLDCGLSYDVPLIITLGSKSNDQLLATPLGGSFTAGDEAEISWTDEDGEYIVQRFEVISSGVFRPFDLEKFRTTPLPDSFNTSARIREAVKVVSGAGHLNGMNVSVLADGNVLENIPVVGGAVTLPYKAARVHLGLPYEARLRTLNLDTDKGIGQFQIKAISEVVISLEKSRGILAGAIGGELYELKPRSFEQYYEPNMELNGPVLIEVSDEWGTTAGVEVSCPYPLPALIQSIVPEIEYA